PAAPVRLPPPPRTPPPRPARTRAARSMPDPRHVELQAVALRGQEQLEVAVFLGIGRQLVRPDGHLTPLKALADVPDRLLAGAPGGEMVELAALLGKPLAADPLERAALRQMTIDAGEVELAESARRQRVAAIVGRLGRGARRVDLDLAALGEESP